MSIDGRISSKPYKQWCKARGIDFNSHVSQFPLAAKRLGIVMATRNNPIVKPLIVEKKPIIQQEKPKSLLPKIWRWIASRLKNKK